MKNNCSLIASTSQLRTHLIKKLLLSMTVAIDRHLSNFPDFVDNGKRDGQMGSTCQFTNQVEMPA